MQITLIDVQQYVTYAATTFVTAGFGAYFGSYLRSRKKGSYRSHEAAVGRQAHGGAV